MDVAVDGNFAGKLTPHLMAELRGWIALPLIALGLAGLLALLLAAARVPGVELILPWTGPEAFRRILVVHVTFAFVVWENGAAKQFDDPAMTEDQTDMIGWLAMCSPGAVAVAGFGEGCRLVSGVETVQA